MKKRVVNEMKKGVDRWVLVFGIIMVILVAISWRPSLDGSDNPEQQTIFGDLWRVTGVRQERNSQVDGIDGTDELIYVEYVAEPYIDVYDLSGAFQYTIHLPNAQRGGLRMECRDGILIAQSETDTIFLFRGTEFIESMDYDQAKERGLLPQYDRSRPYRLTPTHVVREDGEELFELPPELAENLQRRVFLEAKQIRVVDILVLGGFAAVWLSAIGSFIWFVWSGYWKRQ